MLPTFIITTPNSQRIKQTLEHLHSRCTGAMVHVSQPAATVAASINAAHKYIVRLAHIQEYPAVCIMEDDVYFPAIDGWQYFYQQWRELVNHLRDKAGTNSYIQPIHIYSACNYHSNPTVWTGAHCYIIHRQYYSQFLSTPPDSHIDSAQPANTVQTPPLIAALQRPGFSANNSEWVDHNIYLKPEQVYGGIPEWKELPDAINQQIQQP